MKTKFVWVPHRWSNNLISDVWDYEHYEEYYKEHGWSWDKNMQEIYLVINHQVNLSKGDQVQFAYVGCPFVHLVEYDAIDNIMIYYINEDIPK